MTIQEDYAAKEANFANICNELTDLLEKEYTAVKTGDFDALHALNIRKNALQEEFQGFLFIFTDPGKTIPAHLQSLIDKVHKASTRNTAILAGAIEGASAVVRELRRITHAEIYTGLYNKDGSLRPSETSQKFLGTV